MDAPKGPARGSPRGEDRPADFAHTRPTASPRALERPQTSSASRSSATEYWPRCPRHPDRRFGSRSCCLRQMTGHPVAKGTGAACSQNYCSREIVHFDLASLVTIRRLVFAGTILAEERSLASPLEFLLSSGVSLGLDLGRPLPLLTTVPSAGCGVVPPKQHPARHRLREMLSTAQPDRFERSSPPVCHSLNDCPLAISDLL